MVDFKQTTIRSKVGVKAAATRGSSTTLLFQHPKQKQAAKVFTTRHTKLQHLSPKQRWWESFSHCIKYDKKRHSENGKVPIYTMEKARIYPHAEKCQSSLQRHTWNYHWMGFNFTTTDLWSSQPHMSLTVHWFTVREKNSFWQNKHQNKLTFLKGKLCL